MSKTVTVSTPAKQATKAKQPSKATSATKATQGTKAPAKAASAAKPRQSAAPGAIQQTIVYSKILADALAGKLDKSDSTRVHDYFDRANKYHGKKSDSAFPRAAYAAHYAAWLALPVEKAKTRISEILARIEAGFGQHVQATPEARALYDLMRTK